MTPRPGEGAAQRPTSRVRRTSAASAIRTIVPPHIPAQAPQSTPEEPVVRREVQEPLGGVALLAHGVEDVTEHRDGRTEDESVDAASPQRSAEQGGRGTQSQQPGVAEGRARDLAQVQVQLGRAVEHRHRAVHDQHQEEQPHQDRQRTPRHELHPGHAVHEGQFQQPGFLVTADRRRAPGDRGHAEQQEAQQPEQRRLGVSRAAPELVVVQGPDQLGRQRFQQLLHLPVAHHRGEQG